MVQACNPISQQVDLCHREPSLGYIEASRKARTLRKVCLFVLSNKQQTNKLKELDNRGIGTSAGERVIGHSPPS